MKEECERVKYLIKLYSRTRLYKVTLYLKYYTFNKYQFIQNRYKNTT